MPSCVRAFIGWDGDRPVATASATVHGGVNHVEMVSTMSDCRGRGYGEAITWAATQADPTLPAVLVASDLGRPVYERMGYLAVDRWTPLVPLTHPPFELGEIWIGKPSRISPSSVVERLGEDGLGGEAGDLERLVVVELAHVAQRDGGLDAADEAQRVPQQAQLLAERSRSSGRRTWSIQRVRRPARTTGGSLPSRAAASHWSR